MTPQPVCKNPETKTAIVYVDVQRAYCDPAFCPPEDDPAPFVAAAQEIASFDARPDLSAFLKIRTLDATSNRGMEPVGLSHDDTVPVFVKHTPDSFSNPQFDSCLRDHDVKRLLIAGVVRSICVFTAALTGVIKKYDVEVLLPLTADYHEFYRHPKGFGETGRLSMMAGKASHMLSHIIWRNDLEQITEPASFVHEYARQVGWKPLDADSVISFYKTTSQEACKDWLRKLKNIEGKKFGDVRKRTDAPWVALTTAQINGENILAVRALDHPNIQRFVENRLGKPHAYVLVPKVT